MQRLHKRISFALASAFGIAVLAVAPVWAEHGNTTSSDSSSGTTTSGSQSTHKSEVHTANSSSGGADTEANDTTTSASDENGATSGSDSLHDRAEQLLAKKRLTGHEKSVAVRQKACDQRHANIDGRLNNLGTKAQKFLDRYNTIFTKVQAYQTKNQLDVSNYDALVADTTAKQATATTAVATLSGLAGTKIDCTSTDPASSLAKVKTAADDAKTSLQAYRASLKTLIQALISAHKAASTDTSNTSGSN